MSGNIDNNNIIISDVIYYIVGLPALVYDLYMSTSPISLYKTKKFVIDIYCIENSAFWRYVEITAI